jgi:hypothetical protein
VSYQKIDHSVLGFFFTYDSLIDILMEQHILDTNAGKQLSKAAADV